MTGNADSGARVRDVLAKVSDLDWWFDTPEDVQQQWLIDRLTELLALTPNDGSEGTP